MFYGPEAWDTQTYGWYECPGHLNYQEWEGMWFDPTIFYWVPPQLDYGWSGGYATGFMGIRGTSIDPVWPLP